jgi:hypothetical protein
MHQKQSETAALPTAAFVDAPNSRKLASGMEGAKIQLRDYKLNAVPRVPAPR